MTEPVVSVVVPVRDGAHLLPALLQALDGQVGAPPFEVVVVDNASRDPLTVPPHVRLVREDRPGSYAARNAGVAAARGSLLAFTDADCRPLPGWLAAGVRALVDADAAGGEVRAVVGDAPTLWERYDRAVYLDQGRAVRDEGYAATANLFVRREVFDRVGPFDAALRSSGDLEWGQRATRAGVRLVHAPDAVVEHVARRTPGETWRLHRRLGAGWRDLAARGLRPPAHREPALRVPLRWAAGRVLDDGLGRSRAGVVLVHATVLAARWTGRLRGDGRRR